MSSITASQSLQARLNREWADSFSAQVCDFEELGSCTAEEMLARIRTSKGREQDRVIHALLVMVSEGKQDAERVLLQCLLPVAARMASRVKTLDEFSVADRVSYAIGEAWAVIRTYPLRREEKVHANLTMSLLHQLTWKTSNETHVESRTFATSDEHLEVIIGADEKPERTAEAKLADLFTWALNARVINRSEVALLSRVALGDESLSHIAGDLKVTARCLAKRVERIRLKLSAEVCVGTR